MATLSGNATEITESLASSVTSDNALSKIIAGTLPLVIVIYYMYQSTNSYLNLFLGIFITFLIGLVAFLCGCRDKQPSSKVMITVGIVICYAIVATMTSVNIKKLSKFRYFWVNLIVQYSLFINVFIILLAQSKKN
jgi:xanthine/uracil permease